MSSTGLGFVPCFENIWRKRVWGCRAGWGGRELSQARVWRKSGAVGEGNREGGAWERGKRAGGIWNHAAHDSTLVTTAICSSSNYNTGWPFFFFFKAKPYYCGVQTLKSWQSRGFISPPCAGFPLQAPCQEGSLFTQICKPQMSKQSLIEKEIASGWS